MPFSSTRIEPSLALVATAIFSPVAAGLGDGLAAGVDGLLPPQAAASRTVARAKSFDFIHPDTRTGYERAIPASRTQRSGRRRREMSSRSHSSIRRWQETTLHSRSPSPAQGGPSAGARAAALAPPASRSASASGAAFPQAPGTTR